MTYKGKWPGTWATICDVCGFRFPSDKLLDRWDGLKVCKKDWELRHPQDFIQIPEEVVVPPWTRPNPSVYTYTANCTIITTQGVAGVGQSGCARAGFNQHINYMSQCPLVPTSIAGVTISGCAVTGTPRSPL